MIKKFTEFFMCIFLFCVLFFVLQLDENLNPECVHFAFYHPRHKIKGFIFLYRTCDTVFISATTSIFIILNIYYILHNY